MLRKVFAASLLLAFPVVVSATPKYAKETKKPCTLCHVKAGKPELTAVGKCFKDNKHQLGDCKKKAKKS